MSGNGNKKSGGLLKPASWALLLGLLLVLPVSRSFVMAGSFAGSSNNVLPGVVNSGGQDGVSSASNNLISDVEEIGQSTYTSTNYILQPGFGNLMAWPETIQNISASTGAAEGTIDLAWIAPKADGSTGTAAAYAIRYSSVAADSPALSEMQFWLSKPITDFVPVPAPLPCGATQHLIIPGLEGGVTYYFAIKAKADWNAWGYLSGEATSKARLFTPAFSGFSTVETSTIQFNWTADGNLSPGTKFRVLVSTAPDPLDAGGAVVTSSDTYNLFLSSSGLSSNTTYYFRVAGLNKDEAETNYTDARGTSTLAAQPSGFDFVFVSSAVVTMNWNASVNGPGTLYRVYVSTAPDPRDSGGAVVTSSDTYNAYVSTTGLNPDTKYYFRAAAINNNGLITDYSDAVSTTTLAKGVLAAPLAGGLDVYSSSITAHWTLVSGATGYTLAASRNIDITPENIIASSITASFTFATVEELDADTSYYLFVRANGEETNSGWSSYPSAYTLLAYMPAFDKFDNVEANSADFQWSANGNVYPGTKFRVLVSTAPDPMDPGTALVSSSDTYNLSLSTAGLSPNTVYYFRVAGLNKADVATDFITARSTITRVAAPAFSGFTGVSESAVQFNWSPEGNPDGTLYRVYVSTAQDPFNADGAVVTSSDTYNLSLSSTGLYANTTYYFAVAGVNYDGRVTDYTLTVGTSTLLAYDPIFINFTNVDAGAIQFNWSAPDNPDGTLYRVYVSTAQDPFNADGAVVTSSDTYSLSLSSTG
ncbi:MAG TPA: hypothetical protein DCL44_11990, partial [Elusimicrobia bacterium]|nr:hypothetical protein [Elusimicrobiota bacterium]